MPRCYFLSVIIPRHYLFATVLSPFPCSLTFPASFLLVFLRPTIMLGKADAVAATDEKLQSLWEINLGVRKKLGLPDPERPPTKDSLFRPQPD